MTNLIMFSLCFLRLPMPFSHYLEASNSQTRLTRSLRHSSKPSRSLLKPKLKLRLFQLALLSFAKLARSQALAGSGRQTSRGQHRLSAVLSGLVRSSLGRRASVRAELAPISCLRFTIKRTFVWLSLSQVVVAVAVGLVVAAQLEENLKLKLRQQLLWNWTGSMNGLL